jgi:hypothetical protein
MILPAHAKAFLVPALQAEREGIPPGTSVSRGGSRAGFFPQLDDAEFSGEYQ